MEALVWVVLLCAAAVGLEYTARRGRRKLGELSALEATSVADLLAEAKTVTSTFGSSALRRPAKLYGIGHQGTPSLTGPLSGEAVLWFETTVQHHFWAEQIVTDKQGRKQIKRSKRIERLSKHVTSSGTLIVDDGSGQISVELDGARIDGAVTTADRMSPTLPRLAGDGAAKSSAAARSGVNTIGFKCVEKAIRADVPLFVHGTASVRPGTDEVRLRHDSALPLLVSARTEHDVLTSRRNTAVAQSVLAGVLGFAAVIVSITSIVQALASPEQRPALAASERAGDEASGPRPQTDGQALMPNLTGQDLQQAQDRVQRLGILHSSSRDLHADRAQLVDANWQVCTQTPAVGSALTPSTTVAFGVVRVAEDCP